MKIIGVTGKSGAGKSTFSKILGERKNVGVISLDNIMADIKEENFQNQIKERNKENQPVLLSNKLRTFINSNKITFKMFMALKKIMMKKRVEEAIENFKRDGKDAVVIEGIYLKEMIDTKLFDSVILVRRPYESRVKALKLRDDITKEEIVERDLPYKKNYAKHSNFQFDYVVDNRFGIEELKAATEKIYDEVVGIKTFDERYVVREKSPTLKNIVKVIEKSVTKSRKQGIREEY